MSACYPAFRLPTGLVPALCGRYIFTALRNARIASALLAMANSVRPSICLSVCLSVTRRYCVKTIAHSMMQFALSDIKMCLVL